MRNIRPERPPRDARPFRSRTKRPAPIASVRDAARGARARVPDCVLRLRPPARHRFPSRRHERHPRQGLSASESLKLRALRPHAFRTDSRPSASLKLLFSETHKMEMTHYMELMMGSWHMLGPLHGRTDAARGVLRRERNPSAHQAASGRRPRRLQQGLGLMQPRSASRSSRAAWPFSSRRSSHGAPGSTPFRPSPTWPRAFRSSTSAFSRRPSSARSRTAVCRRGRSALARRWSSISSSPHAAMVFGMFDPRAVPAGGLRTTCT